MRWNFTPNAPAAASGSCHMVPYRSEPFAVSRCPASVVTAVLSSSTTASARRVIVVPPTICTSRTSRRGRRPAPTPVFTPTLPPSPGGCPKPPKPRLRRLFRLKFQAACLTCIRSRCARRRRSVALEHLARARAVRGRPGAWRVCAQRFGSPLTLSHRFTKSQNRARLRLAVPHHPSPAKKGYIWTCRGDIEGL